MVHCTSSATMSRCGSWAESSSAKPFPSFPEGPCLQARASLEGVLAGVDVKKDRWAAHRPAPLVRAKTGVDQKNTSAHDFFGKTPLQQFFAKRQVTKAKERSLDSGSGGSRSVSPPPSGSVSPVSSSGHARVRDLRGISGAQNLAQNSSNMPQMHTQSLGGCSAHAGLKDFCGSFSVPSPDFSRQTSLVSASGIDFSPISSPNFSRQNSPLSPSCINFSPQVSGCESNVSCAVPASDLQVIDVDACGSGDSFSESFKTGSRVWSPQRGMREDVEFVMSILNDEDKAQLRRPLFLEDCRRRFRKLDTLQANLLTEKQLQNDLLSMFPTLALDFESGSKCIPAVQHSMPELIAVFDSDHDGSINETDFIDLMKFCHSWRLHFYLALPKESSEANGKRLGSSTDATGDGLLSKTAERPMTQSSRRRRNSTGNLSMSPSTGAKGRRNSGFGPRLLMGDSASAGDLQSVKSRSSDVQLLQSPAIENSIDPFARTVAGKMKEKRRRHSISSTQLDRSRGAFYGTFCGWKDQLEDELDSPNAH